MQHNKPTCNLLVLPKPQSNTRNCHFALFHVLTFCHRLKSDQHEATFSTTAFSGPCQYHAAIGLSCSDFIDVVILTQSYNTAPLH